LGDRWAHYYTAQEYDDVQGRLNGRYSGVGLWLGTAEGAAVRVASVQPGSAAGRAGVRVGDVVIAVAGSPATGWSVTEVATALRGRPAGEVELTVRRAGLEHRFQLRRSLVETTDVTVRRRPGQVRFIQVSAFTRGVGRQVRRAVTTDPAGHAGGLVLDLRGNPGGLLDEAVETASAFLTGGRVVTYEKRGAAPQRFDVTAPGDGRTPLVVLVDAGTASAAEVVAGSLSDRDRAVIVGSRTFGKGSVQEPVRLADGSALELTVGRYRTPAGRNLDGVGIDPDVAISADRPPLTAEQRALAVLRGLLATLPTKDRG
jgi:carboxyl-terminal processing protease